MSSAAVFFLHDYYPGAVTVKEKFLDNSGPAIPEQLLFSFAIQIALGIKCVCLTCAACAMR